MNLHLYHIWEDHYANYECAIANDIIFSRLYTGYTNTIYIIHDISKNAMLAHR